MNADNSHAERKTAKRAGDAIFAAYARPYVNAAVGVYDDAGGLANAWRARLIATAFLVRELRVDENKAAELLADALARRAANKLQPGG